MKISGIPSVSGRQPLLLLIVILAIVALFTTGVTNYFLYNAAFEQNRERLLESAQSHARIMEAVARFDQQYSTDYPKGATAATLSQIENAHDNLELFGETVEFTLARREKDQIVFLFRRRHRNLETPTPISFDSELAEPMREALLGQSGTLVGLDYRGETVVAAHEPVAVLNLGIVAKIDLSEIRAPFVETGIITGILALLAILAGAFLFVLTTNPMLRKIQGSEAKYRDLVETSQDMIWRLDVEGRFTYLNLAWESTLGFSLEEMDGQTFTSFKRPEEAERTLQTYKQILQGGSAANYETTYISKTGKEIILNFKAKPILDASGQIVGTQGTATDITERCRADELLRGDEKRFRGLIENSMQPQLVVQQLKPVFVNQAFVDQFRFGSRDEVLALPDLTVTMQAQDVAEFTHQHFNDLKGEIARPIFERVVVRADGTQFRPKFFWNWWIGVIPRRCWPPFPIFPKKLRLWPT
jgi:PAS domain S-box-containing protein